ncbi:inositol hexakisphosphate and diphosphoinositol-pentakisphosphate kinase 1 [Stylonychia lemnae]|uniref:Inositol hexakisphosphate and diphosphoinositol-pentakisphosphate kinase n=1 Tax=Stylonychia lemnae TaxID=5949 RepID=A0A078AQT8_STYLE|nr:inositol hexakisphosphate and diphosphoinositol-pentakisphosphate kinase 1 [Stylonychia lemnae]|eukprot:CDW83263.1 inositol hexakisphosphate and diphosphoinositol-pentakisphosphate kinase 1 [Stylonychia lemnae]
MNYQLNFGPMKSILEFISEYEEFEILTFDQDMIFNKPIEKILWDRRKTYKILKQHNIPMATHYFVNRKDTPEMTQDYLESLGEFQKHRGEELIKKAKSWREQFSKVAGQARSSQTDELSNQGQQLIPMNPSITGLGSISPSPSFEEFKLSDQESKKNYSQADNNAGLSGDDQDYSFENHQQDELLYEDQEVGIQEYEDYLIINGKRLDKPYVEKPVNAEDHEVIIYYSSHSPCGAGYNVLFRKTGNYCSQFFPTLEGAQIRQKGSYIYEEFLSTDGFDIKVYTVGADYAHAEARKCPTLDGIVQRDENGKEVRYPVNLTQGEKEIARKIAIAFKQEICGFDMLRSKGQSYVCDVNGFAFVKTSKKFYQDCANQISRIIMKKLFRNWNDPNPTQDQQLLDQIQQQEQRPYRPQEIGTYLKSKWELRSVVAVFRHGDRTPKQKMKMRTKDVCFLKFFDNRPNQKKEVKLKNPRELLKLLEMTKRLVEQILKEHDLVEEYQEDEREKLAKLIQLRNVLERDRFEGLNRKVGSITHINLQIQLRPLVYETVTNSKGEQIEKVIEALFILKWGGELTHAGVKQAIDYGTKFRETMYEDKSGGLLRLHSTYRHDLKCYTSDEGRCQKTAAAFLKGLLQLEGALAPILVIMVRKDEATNLMLDDNSSAEKLMNDIKKKLTALMHQDKPLLEAFQEMFNNTPKQSLQEIMKRLGNPLKRMDQMFNLIQEVTESLKKRLNEETEQLQANSYLITSPNFEKVFNLNYQYSNLEDKQTDRNIQTDTNSEENKDNHSNKHLNIPKQHQQSNKKIEIVKQEIQQNLIRDDKSVAGCEGEQQLLMFKRWRKLEKDFKKKDNTYDISKIPDIWDNIKYDVLHNPHMIDDSRKELFDVAELMSQIIVPMEYGTNAEEKLNIGFKIIHLLLNKIHHDLLWWTSPEWENMNHDFVDEYESWEQKGLDQSRLEGLVKSHWRHMRTRLYFTSASHMYTLLNTLKLGLNQTLIDQSNLKDKEALNNITTIDYMSGIVFRLYENLGLDEDDPDRFKLEIMVNRGAVVENFGENIENHTIPISQEKFIDINKKLTFQDVDKFFKDLLLFKNLEEQNLAKDSENSPNSIDGRDDKVKSNGGSPLLE